MLLNWGETAEQLVIDPEYLSNMEHPRSSLASEAGLRVGYGSAIAASTTEGFPMLGHGGGIDGFSSLYAYSTSRDVGYVVLLNSTHSPEAMRRISQLAVRYLKADVEPPARPRVTLAADALRQVRGLLPQGQSAESGRRLPRVAAVGRHGHGDRRTGLRVDPVFGSPEDLIPVADNLFRTEADAEATRVFAEDDSGVDGADRRLRRTPSGDRDGRSRLVRWSVLLSFALGLTPLADAAAVGDPRGSRATRPGSGGRRAR